MSGLQLYNTLSRRKEAFEPLEPGHVRIYSCGPTVYSAQHIGNLRPYLFADLLRRTLEYEGYRVTHVINITDVGHLTDDADAGEDKMEVAARQSGRRAGEIAAEFERQWKEDCRRVGCLPAHHYPRASEHIPEQIEMARALEAGGYTYRIDDGLYFDVSRFPRYAELARLDLEGQEGGARIGDVQGKRNAADFAVWKFAAPGVKRQQEWDSPWGRGFPGWHLECSAMSVEYLGTTFDIHTGGVDHIPVHHSNEIAQSECALGVHPWVHVWMHEEFLDFRGEKMSKSKGNIYVLDDLVAQGVEPLAYRYFFLQAHYRQQQTFTDEALAAAATGHDRLVALAATLREAAGPVDEAKLAAQRERFREALRDDLNAPRAMAVVWEVARSADLSEAERWALLADFDRVLGLDLANAVPRAAVRESDPRIDALVAEREEARARKDFATADRIRDELAAEGILLEDTPDGARWRRRP
ncbi:MAG: cysteine--tRNA ligase [Myxococcota bacterium]|nr:cysteine--tRNA ligase [Myxococcota bacterium]